MSRREIGDWVWVKRGGSFGKSLGEWAVVLGEPTTLVPEDWTLPCPYDCGDPGCRQWGNLEAERGVTFQYVSECEMSDDGEDS
jgi:hypothetical protein